MAKSPRNHSVLPPAGNLERRFTTGDIRFRAKKTEGSIGTLEGYAATFNTTSVDLGGFLELIMPGAFDSVMQDDCRCLFNHKDDAILGRSSADTLELLADDFGLKFRCDMPDTQMGRDVARSIRRRDITGASFSFTLLPDDQEWDFDLPIPIRSIRRVNRLFDVGPVTFPAYESTTVDMRSFTAARATAEAAQRLVVQRSLDLAKARLRLAAAFLT